MRTRVACVVAIAGALIASTRAQERPAQFRARTDIVTIDVTVLDRDRKPVRGLTSADFVVVDDGQQQPLVGFSAIALPAAVARPPGSIQRVAADVAGNEAADGRLVTIMFDHSIPSGWGARAARRIARSVVDQLGMDDRAAIVFSDRALSQSFTNDRARLMAAIDNPVVGTSPAQSSGVGASAPALPSSTAWSIDQQRQEMSPAPTPASGNCHCGLCSLETIATVAESVVDVSERRKLLVFIGGYLPLNPEAWGRSGSPACQPRYRHAIQRALESAQRANLTIYAFDPNGLVPPAQYGAGARLVGGAISTREPGSQGSLRAPETLLAAADHTGGRAIVNTNAPEERVVEAFDETSSYYLVGFEPHAGATPGSFRNIRVRVNRPGVQVITRRGYYVPGTAGAAAGGDVDPLMTALRSLLPRTTMPMRLSLAAFPSARSDGASVLAVTTAIDRDAAGPIDLLAVAFDRTGRPAASLRRTIEPEVTGAGADEAFVRLDLPKPGGYHVRIAARDSATGRIATVHDIADVPAFAAEPLSLSGLVVHTSRTPQRSITALSDFLPVVPTTRRTFGRAESVAVYAQVIQRPPLAPVQVTARVLDRDGAPVLEHREAIDESLFAGAAASFYRLDLPLARLAAGSYALTIEAARGTDHVTRTLRFEAADTPVR